VLAQHNLKKETLRKLPAQFLFNTIWPGVCCSNLTDTLFILFLYNNNFEGDLNMMSGANLGVVSTADNPKLCGMVPAAVRWAHGYNPHNTSLGLPCM